MSRVQLALRVPDLQASIGFYTKLFGTAPAKQRPGYANFAVAEPPLKLVLLEGEPGDATFLDHLGVEVETAGQVGAAAQRLAGEGLATAVQENTTCCYALQDKVWVHGPGHEPWEVYVVKADAATLADTGDPACCPPDAAGQMAGEAGDTADEASQIAAAAGAASRLDAAGQTAGAAGAAGQAAGAAGAAGQTAGAAGAAGQAAGAAGAAGQAAGAASQTAGAAGGTCC